MTSKKDELKKAWREQVSKFKKSYPSRFAMTGDKDGNIFYSRDPKYMWAREYNSPNAFLVLHKGKVGPYANLPVILGYEDEDSDREQILNVNYDFFISDSGSTNYGIGPHAVQHMFGGGDEVWLDSRLFLPGQLYPTNPASLQLRIQPFYFYKSGFKYFPGSTTNSLSAYKPASATDYIRYVTIAVDADTNTVTYRPSDLVSGTLAQSTWDYLITAIPGSAFAEVVDMPANEIVLGVAILGSATTQIQWTGGTSNLIDTRFFLQPNIKDVRERIFSIEGNVGNSFDLPTTGANTNNVDSFKANSWAIQDTPVSLTRPIANQYLVFDGLLYQPSQLNVIPTVTKTIELVPFYSSATNFVTKTTSSVIGGSSLGIAEAFSVNSAVYFSLKVPTDYVSASKMSFNLVFDSSASNNNASKIRLAFGGISGSDVLATNSWSEYYTGTPGAQNSRQTIKFDFPPSGITFTPYAKVNLTLQRQNVASGNEYNGTIHALNYFVLYNTNKHGENTL